MLRESPTFMEPPIPVPRQALAELLRAAGSPLTPEQYVASLSPLEAFKKYPSRAKASFLSKTILVIAAIISGVWVCLPIGFDLEGVAIAVALAVITFFEYRVHKYFVTLNPEAPLLGFRNQSVLAAIIFVYGIYHALLPFQLPPEMENMVDPATVDQMRIVIRYGYVAIGVLGGLSQLGLAWYYWTARGADRGESSRL
jgi:hypothetical protein